MLAVVAASPAAYVAMHWRAHSDDHAAACAAYDGPGGVVGAVRQELAERVEAMPAAGIARDRIVLDPGLGFAKTAEHNWALLARPRRARRAWASRCWSGPAARRSSARCWPVPTDAPRPVDEREHASTALTVLLAQRGVWGLRVHDVRAARDALLDLDRWQFEQAGRRPQERPDDRP